MTDPVTITKSGEAVEGRAREMLQALIGDRYSDTTLRVAIDWLKREARLASTPSTDNAELVAPLLALAEAGIPPDIQELLVWGDPSRSIPPGALGKALAAIRNGPKQEVG